MGGVGGVVGGLPSCTSVRVAEVGQIRRVCGCERQCLFHSHTHTQAHNTHCSEPGPPSPLHRSQLAPPRPLPPASLTQYFNNETFEAERFDKSLAGFEAASVKTQSSLSFLNVGQNLIFSGGLVAAMGLAVQGISEGR